MTDRPPLISEAFATFQREAPSHAHAWGHTIQDLAQAGALDAKTRTLCYLSVLAALRLETGVPFHAVAAKAAGASRDEVIDAVLVGLPAAGHGVTQALPGALAAYDEAD
jgi:alkylhydroperoxidase/carboxymuconolactone decarboxylase family protein YurZ